MNLILLFPNDFVTDTVVRLTDRRLTHIRLVLRARVGDALRVGLVDGNRGKGVVRSLTNDTVEMDVHLSDAPPAAPPLSLFLALPRPKALRRIVQGIVSLGVKRIFLFNAWRVEKSYWQSPFLGDEALREQIVLGLEQAGDTVMPSISLRKLFKPFVEDEIPAIVGATRALIADPAARDECPCKAPGETVLAIGPEGGFTQYELDALTGTGFAPVRLGERVLRMEQAVPALLGRLI